MPMIVVCVNCKWQHFAVTKECAEAEIKRFNDWYDTQPDSVRECYRGHSSMKNYHCFACGGQQFRPRESTDKDITGSTIQPAIYEEVL